MFMTDFVINGEGHGDLGSALMEYNFDPGLMRPYFDSKGNRCVSANTGKRNNEGRIIFEKRRVGEYMARGVVINGPTTLRKDDWMLYDRAVVDAARTRLRAWGDLAASNTFGGFDGMSSLILETESANDPGEAFVDFDAMTEGRNFAPKYQLEGVPLPITHADFWISKRRLAISRKNGRPLDTTLAAAAGRRVAEKIEGFTIGTTIGPAFGDIGDYTRVPQVFGYTNFPSRIIKDDLTAPTTGGWTPAVLVTEVIEMMQLSIDAGYYGPWMLYTSTDWDTVLESDYNTNYGGVTLRQRLLGLQDLRGVRRLDGLTSVANPYTLVLVQMTGDVARAVDGMGITTVQWESMGGMRLNFKVMAIQVPNLRADFNGSTGIVHGTTS